MITTKLYLDTRAVKDGEPAPLKVAITKKRQAAYIPLGVKLKKEQWDAKKQRIVDAPNKQRLELFVKNKLVEIDNAILELQMKGELTKQTSTQIKNKVVAYLDPDVKKKDYHINSDSRYIYGKGNYGTGYNVQFRQELSCRGLVPYFQTGRIQSGTVQITEHGAQLLYNRRRT